MCGKFDTRTYHDFTIDHSYFKGDLIFTKGNEMRMTCFDLFKRKYKQMRKILIPLCIKSHDRYYFNILRIITIFYHLYIEHEIYNLAYNKNKGFLNDILFIKVTMGKRDGYYTLLKIIRRRGNQLYVKL